MNPTFLDSMSWEMAEVYGAITDQILINLARYFPYYKAGKIPKSAFTYQSAMLAQMGQVNADTVRIIRNNLQGADDALQRVLEQAIIDSVKKTEPGLLKAVKAGILKPVGTPVVSPNQMRAFQLYYQQASDKLNLVNTVMLESTKQAYQACVSDVVADIELSERINNTYQALDIAAGETITGVSSWNQAMSHAMDRLKDRGITGFVDHAGHQWSAEAYVAMDIRTTVYNTSRAAVWETNQDMGNDLYIVSYHDGARPLCYPWQNKVISSTNNAREITDLYGNVIQVIAQSDTSYGEPAGLFGINCKHYPSPFIPGVSVLYDADNIPDEKENEKVYNQLQQQRSLERTIREQKRDLLMEKARGADPETLKAMRAKIRETDDKIDAFCDETGLPRRQNREGVYTKREFPDANKYDVSTFERTQKDAIDKYFSNNGAQQNYAFTQMTPKEPIEPISPKPEKTFKTVEDYDKEIQRLRDERLKLFEQEMHDKKETDRLLNEIFDVQDKRSAFIASQRPMNEPEIMKQFKRYDVDSKTAAQKLAQVNPNYRVEGQGNKWTYNCQRTVVAQEMVYRGYDVTAMPYNRADAIGSNGVAVWDAPKFFWTDPDVRVVAKRAEFMETVGGSMSEWGDGSRAIVRLQWQRKYGGNGHFIFARQVNGKTIFEDPQSGVVLDMAEKLKKTTTGKNAMWVMRVDNRAVNDKITLAIKNVGD